MEIGNIQHDPACRADEQRQRQVDVRNIALVVCHKKGCRPWQCEKSKAVDNVELTPTMDLAKKDFDLTDDVVASQGKEKMCQNTIINSLTLDL